MKNFRWESLSKGQKKYKKLLPKSNMSKCYTYLVINFEEANLSFFLGPLSILWEYAMHGREVFMIKYGRI